MSQLDFLNAEEIAALEGITKEGAIKRIRKGYYKNARKASDKLTATWLVPRASYEATLPPKEQKPTPTKNRARRSQAAKARPFTSQLESF